MLAYGIGRVNGYEVGQKDMEEYIFHTMHESDYGMVYNGYRYYISYRILEKKDE